MLDEIPLWVYPSASESTCFSANAGQRYVSSAQNCKRHDAVQVYCNLTQEWCLPWVPTIMLGCATGLLQIFSKFNQQFLQVSLDLYQHLTLTTSRRIQEKDLDLGHRVSKSRQQAFVSCALLEHALLSRELLSTSRLFCRDGKSDPQSSAEIPTEPTNCVQTGSDGVDKFQSLIPDGSPISVPGSELRASEILIKWLWGAMWGWRGLARPG